MIFKYHYSYPIIWAALLFNTTLVAKNTEPSQGPVVVASPCDLEKSNAKNMNKPIIITQKKSTNRLTPIYLTTFFFLLGNVSTRYLLLQYKDYFLKFFSDNNKTDTFLKDLSGYLCSTVHHIVIVLLASSYWLGLFNTQTWQKSLAWSQGYLIADLCLFSLYQEEEYTMYLHHIVALFLLISYQYKDPQWVARSLLAEFSSIPLHISWYLFKTGQEETVLFSLVAGLTLCLYFILRIINFTHLFYRACQEKKPFLHLLIGFSLLVLNYYWFFQLVKRAVETFFGYNLPDHFLCSSFTEFLRKKVTPAAKN